MEAGGVFLCLGISKPFLTFSPSLAPSCGSSAEKFRSFLELNSDFAEDFLYAENPNLQSGTCHHHEIKTSPSSLNPRDTATPKLSNGICPDFSPNDHAAADGLLKKHNWAACWDETKASPGERRLFPCEREARGATVGKGTVYIPVTTTATFTFSFLSASAPWKSPRIFLTVFRLFCEEK